MAANPELKGKRFMHIFEATVEANLNNKKGGGVFGDGGSGWSWVGLGWVVGLV